MSGVLKEKYRVVIPDVDYFAEQVKCRSACPVGTDAGGYVQAIADGDYERAYAIARAPNPFASICGRVCGAPCEAACCRGYIDEAISIRALKRFVTEKYGVEATTDPSGVLKFSNARRTNEGFGTRGKVAIIGAGPAGLAAAHDLVLLGYKVTVFEAEPEPGGMMIMGIPHYKLSRKLIKAEIASIEAMGVEIRCNTSIGKDLSLNDLKYMGYKAILIAAGLQVGSPLPIEGANLSGVLTGIEFIKAVNSGQPPKIGPRVAVIGGGNVAYDVARAAVRLKSKVDIVYRRTKDLMPAAPVEIMQGEEEGLIIHENRAPKRILGRDGKVIGLETIKCVTVFDENKRANLELIPNTESVFECDTVIITIGQAAELSFIEESDGIEMTRPGVLKVNLDNYKTSMPGIFATGDVVAYGPKLVITAVAAGQKVARSIDEYLRGVSIQIRRKGIMHSLGDHKEYKMFGDFDLLGRREPPDIEAKERRHDFSLVEIGYGENEAAAQARRCLKCHINTIFDGDLCILCGGCVDVCPTYCLKLVPLTEIDGDENMRRVVEARYNISWEDLMREGHSTVAQMGMAMLKDEDRCIRCGYCAKRCPTDAVTMEFFEYIEDIEEVPVK